MSFSAGIGHAAFVIGLNIERRYKAARAEAQERTPEYLQGYINGWESRTGPVRKFFYKLFNAAPEVKAFQEELSERKELSDKLL